MEEESNENNAKTIEMVSKPGLMANGGQKNYTFGKVHLSEKRQMRILISRVNVNRDNVARITSVGKITGSRMIQGLKTEFAVKRTGSPITNQILRDTRRFGNHSYAVFLPANA